MLARLKNACLGIRVCPLLPSDPDAQFLYAKRLQKPVKGRQVSQMGFFDIQANSVMRG